MPPKPSWRAAAVLPQHSNNAAASARLADELRADILNGVLQLHLFGNRHAVVHDPRRAVLALQDHIAPLHTPLVSSAPAQVSMMT